ncbi:MAG: murein biosynthesis integral membrane protein MurJ [Leptospiraceae bacterium]|nr:murein biosynthesis integral membrane protein MurJ [Leptospiraceae bacterium]MDW7975410.1 murein biosynthesis integral membrane protein MurJ [Leptospiraceae bacterium]
MSSSAKASVKLTFLTFISRILGLIRDHLLARSFGTGIYSTYWEIAYMFPNMLRNLLAEGVLSQSFVPLYSSSLKESEEKAKRDFGIIVVVVGIFVGFVVLFGIFLFPIVLPYYVGKPKEEIELLILVSQIVFPFIFFISLSSVYAGVLNTHQKYVVPTLSPILLNIDFIITLLLVGVLSHFYFFPKDKVLILLGVMVVVGAVFVLGMHVYFVHKYQWSPKFFFTKDFGNEPVIKDLLRLVVPAILGASIFQLNQLIDIFLASYLVSIEGAIPALRFAHRLIQLPTGLIGVAISTTILPTIALFIRKDVSLEKIGQEVIFALRFSFFLTIPASLGLFLMGPWIVHFLFSGGLWDLGSTFITLWTLQFYSLGIPFYSANKILTSVYYAYQDTKTPIRILLFVVVSNLILNLLLIPFLQHGGLALSTSLSSLLNFILLIYFLRFKAIKLPFDLLKDFLKKQAILMILMFLFLSVVLFWFPFPFQENRFDVDFLFQLNQLDHETLKAPEEIPSRWVSLWVLVLAIGGSILLYFSLSKVYLKEEMNIILSYLQRKKMA